jgi:hypothetical protein
MTPITILSWHGSAIRLRGGMLNLADLWHAAGRPDNRRPSDWLDLEETQRLRTHAGIHWTEIDDPVATHAGPTGILSLDTDGLGTAPAVLPCRPAASLKAFWRPCAGAGPGRGWQGVAHRRRRPGLTLPATTACPPSWTVTCCTVTTWRPP